MPRESDEPDPKPWALFDGYRIGHDVTKRRLDGQVDRRANNTYIIVAQVLLKGSDGQQMAKEMVDKLNRADGF